MSQTSYFCTVSPTCRSTPTTYEKWVAHELLSHPAIPQNFYYCYSPNPAFLALYPDPPPTESCEVAFIKKSDLIAHLQSKHPSSNRYRPQYLISEHAEFHVGPEKDSFYWCGFCRRVLVCNMMGRWQIDRFEHVAGHFMVQHPRLEHFEKKQWMYLTFGEEILVMEEKEVIEEEGKGKRKTDDEDDEHIPRETPRSSDEDKREEPMIVHYLPYRAPVAQMTEKLVKKLH